MGFRPAEFLVVEDSMDGISAALSGGFDVIALASEYNFDLMNKSRVKIIRSMDELGEFLD